MTFGEDVTDTNNLVVKIYSEDGDEPDSALDTLTLLGSITENTEALFTVSSSVTLAKDTSYFIVLEPTGPFTKKVRLTGFDLEDSGGSAGWTIGDDRLWRAGSTGSWSAFSQAVKISVYPPRPPNAEGKPTISGTAQVGQTLTAEIGTIEDDDGLTDSTFPDDYSFQWVRVDGVDETDISGATGSTYDPVADDVGKTLKVKVSFTDDDGTAEGPLESAETEAVASAPAEEEIWSATLTPGQAPGGNAVGFCREGSCGSQAFDAFGSLTDHNFIRAGRTYNIHSLRVGGTSGGVSHLFLRLNDGESMPEADWSGLTLQIGTRSFALSEAREKPRGDSLEATSPLVSGNVRLFAWYDGNTPAVMTTGTAVAVKLVAADTDGAPVVSGVPQVGQTLTAGIGSIADEDGLTNSTFPDDYSFQWVRVDGGTPTDIDGATSDTYTLTADDEGKTVKVEVSFTDDGSNSETRESAETRAVLRKEEDCATDRPGAEWCTTMTVGNFEAAFFGYSSEASHPFGVLVDPNIEQGATTYTIDLLLIVTGTTDKVRVQVAGDRHLPRGTILNLGGTEFTADAASEVSVSFALGEDPEKVHEWDVANDVGWRLRDQKVTVSARLPPELVSATVQGDSVVLTYSEPLDADSVPAVGQFAPMTSIENSSNFQPKNVSINGSAVTLTLANRVSVEEVLTVSYRVPATNPLQDEAGVAALALTDEPATNISTYWSTTLTVGVGSEGPRGASARRDNVFGMLKSGIFSHVGRSISVEQLTADDSTSGAVEFTLSYEDETAPDLSGLTLEFAGENLPLADATATTSIGEDGNFLTYTWTQAWVAANAPSLAATNYAATLPDGGEVLACLRGGGDQMCPRETSTDATLSALALENAADATAIALTPAFAFDTASYTASVASGVTEITVRPTTGDDYASVEYLDASDMAIPDANRSRIGRQVPLSVGQNTIKVKVTAEDDSTVETYTVVVRRAEPTVAALVSNTGQTPATAVEAGASGASRFSVAQSFETGDAGRYALSSVQLYISDFGGTDSADDVTVTIAANGSDDLPGDTLYTLSAASISDGALNTFEAPENAALDGTQTTYWVVVEGGSSLFKVGTASSDALDAGTAAGWDIADGRVGRSSDGGAWSAADAELRIAVSGYAVAAMASSDAALGELRLDSTDLTPEFDPAVTEYRGWSGDSDGMITVRPTRRDGGATVEVLDGDDMPLPDANGGAGGHQVQLEVGVNTLKFRVTAEDRVTTRTYTVSVVQEADEPDPLDADAVWHANLTVETGESGGTALAGYDNSADRGALAPERFRVDSKRIVVWGLEHGGGTLRFRYNTISAGGTLAGGAYVLEVDGHRFNLPDPGPAGDHEFTDPGFSWSRGDVVTVKLLRVADATAPVLERATVSGTSLALIYDDRLDESSVPAASEFSVKVDGGAGAEPDSVSVSGRVALLTLATAVTAAQSVTVSYAKPASSPLRNEAGVDAQALTDRAVTNDTGATPVAVIEAVTESAIFRRDAATFRVSRSSGSLAEALTVDIALSQDRSFLAAGSLAKTVTIPANATGALLTLGPGEFRAFPTGSRIASGGLTATVLDGTDYDVGADASAEVDIRIALTIGPEMSAYTVDESAGTLPVRWIARTGERALLIGGATFLSLSSETRSAGSPGDYRAVSSRLSFSQEGYAKAGTVYENVQTVPFTIVDDTDAEQTETFEMILEMSPGLQTWVHNFVDGDGNACGSSCRYRVSITDNDPADGLSALVLEDADDDTAIALSPAFAADVTAYTAAVADTVTRVTVEPTLAAAGAEISYRDAKNAVIDDADNVADGMQVDLAAGETVIRVRLSRDAPGGNTNVQIYTITVTRVVPVVSGAPKIQGVRQAGQTLTAVQGTIDDEHGLPATAFPLGYTFQWVLVDGSTETDISGETSDTYTLTADDEGKKVKVEVSFTDGASNPEMRESALTGTVLAMQEDCAADRPNADWCTTMTVGRASGAIGYSEDKFGSLAEPTIEYDGTTYTVSSVLDDADDSIFILELDRFLPTDATFNVGGAAFDTGMSYDPEDEGEYYWDSDPSHDWIKGQKVTVSTNLPPFLIAATVDGASLVLTYAEDLDAGSVPAADAFAVTVAGGTPAAPAGVAVSGAAVTLTLANAAAHGQTVTVSYTPPASNPLQDASGFGALALTDEPVVNRAADSTGNRPATGAPVLFVEGHSGYPRVGDTLVADLSAIRDGDGLATAAFTFEWILTRNGIDTTISGAVAGEYLLAPADEGATVGVEVSFTDDGGKAEGPLPSAASGTVAGRPGGSCTSDTVRLVGGDDGSEGSIEYCRSNQHRSVCDDDWEKADADVVCRMAGYPDGALKGTIGSFFVNFLDVSFWLDDVACTGNESSLAECGHAGWGRNNCSYAERAGVVCDIGAPAAVSAAVDGATLTIVFDEDLAAAPNLSNDAFTVYKTPDGGSSQEVALSAVPPTIDGATVTLRLATGVMESDTGIRVEYEKPGTGDGNRLVDGDGVEVESFGRGARNATGVMPVAISAVVDGATLEIAFSKELAAAPNLANTSFTVKKTPSGGSERTESLSGVPSIDGATVTLTLAAPALSSDTDVKVSYEKPASGTGNALEDPSGREVDSFTDRAVINNSNAAATGAPAVTGLPQVGGTLTAALGTIADEDGLPARFPDFYDFQWVRVAGDSSETDIAGATRTRYAVTADDAGSALKVRVTFKDDAGGTEILERATAPVIAAAEDCTDDRPYADWCATMTVGALDRGALGTLYGFNFVDSVGSLLAGPDQLPGLEPNDFPYGTISYTVDELALLDGASSDSVRVEMDRFLPRGSLFNFGGMEFTADASSEQATAGEYEWDVAADFGWRAEGQEVTVSVNRPPGGETAAVNGASLVLTYGEDLDTGSVPAEAAFAVTVDGGAPAAPSAVAVSGNTVTLTLASAVTPGQEVKLTYTVPGSDAVQDESGLEAGGLVNRAVDNETPDARLIALVIENAANDTAIALSPAFDAATAGYTASVANAVDEITVRPTPGDSNASFEYLDAGDMAIADADSVKGGHQVPLRVGVSTIKVKVTAADNATTGIYTLVVRRPLDTSMANQIWTSDLNTTSLTPGTGCDNALNNTHKCSAQLDEDEFDYGDPAIEYAFTRIEFNSGRLDVEWEPDLPATVEDLVLKVSDTGGNTEYFDFANADHKSDGRRYWDGLGSVNGELDQTLTLFLRSPDGTAPAFSSAVVKGALLTITFDEDLAAAANLANSAFTVKKTPQAGSEETVGLTGSPSISGATVTLTLAAAPVSTDTGVKVSYTKPATGTDNKLKDAAGNEVASFTDEPVTVDGTATGAPGISGTPQAGQTLTATMGDIADIDGLPGAFPGDYEFQWVRVVSGTDTPITGETSSTYDPVAADVGSRLKVRVSFTDGGSTDEGPLESAATAAVVAMQEDCAADRPDADWCTTMTVGVLVSADSATYGYSSDRGLGSLGDPTVEHGVSTYTFEDLALNVVSTGTTLVTVLDAFVPRGSVFNFDGDRIFTANSTSEEPTSQYEWDVDSDFGWRLEGQKATVSANLAPAVDSATVDGASLVLTYAEPLDAGSVPAESAYEVTVDGGAAAEPTDVAVSGNTVTLTLASAVTVGQTVTVSYTKPASNPLQDASGLDAPAFTDREVTVGGKPEISGTAQQGKTLTADTSRIRDPDGLTGVSYSYRWMRVDRDGSSNATPIARATSSTYVPASADIGKRLKVEVTFDDDANNPEERVSDAGSVVAPAADLSTCPGDETDVWCATLTSERVDGSHAGFNAEDSLGGLDPLEFELGGVTYEVTGLYSNRAPGTGLLFSTTPNLPADGAGLTLHLQSFGGEHGVPLTASDFGSGRPNVWDFVYPAGNRLAAGPLSEVDLLRGQLVRSAFIREATDDGTEIAVRLSRPANSAATGKPAISGTAVAGRRLTADISGIADGNGLPGGAEDFSYRWVRVDGATETEIPGATLGTYRLQAEDEGKKIKVKVSFTDRNLYDEGPVESDAFPSGSATIGPAPPETVLLETVLTVKTKASGVNGCINSSSDRRCSDQLGEDSFTSSDLDGDAIALRVHTLQLWEKIDTVILHFDRGRLRDYELENLVLVLDGRSYRFSDALHGRAGHLTWYGESPQTWSEGQTVEVQVKDVYANRPARGRPSISGEARVGATLTAARGTIADRNGLPDTFPDDYSLQWVRVDDGAGTRIAGATSSTYTPTAEDRGMKLRVEASFTDDDGNAEGPLASAAWPRDGGVAPALAPATNVALDTVLRPISFGSGYPGLGPFKGCYDGSKGHSCYYRLAQHSFEYRGGKYRIRQLYVNGGRLTMGIGSPGQPHDYVLSLDPGNGMVVELDLGPFALSGSKALSERAQYWDGTGLDWSEADRVRVRVCDGPCQRLLSVGDVQAHESGGTASLDFVVRLDPASDSEVTVAYATSDVTAIAGEDYSETSGTLTFAAGETEKTVSVPVLDDSEEDSGETVRFTLSGATGAAIGDGEAVGTILNMEAEAALPLTASFSALPGAHDGETGFTFTLTFSEDVEGLSHRTLRDAAFEVTGASVTNASRVTQGSNESWTIAVEPDGDGAVGITLPATTDCAAEGAICAPDGRMLAEPVSATVPGPGTAEAQPLTAAFSGLPSEHDGESVFTFTLTFSEEPKAGIRRIAESVDVAGGSLNKVLRVTRGDNTRWTLRLEPSGAGAVEVSLPATEGACDAFPAICTADGRKLSNASSASVQGPPGLSVADAEVNEAATDAALAFAVTLDRAASGTVTVEYETGDGTATAPADYEETSGTLTFAAGETSKTVSVPVRRDDHDEGSETMKLVLSDPAGAYLKRAEATGTIHNTGHIPQAWIARFGRTVADQVLEAVEARMEASRSAGTEIRIAGQPLGGGSAAEREAEREAEAGLEALAGWLRDETEEEQTALQSRGLTGRDLLTGSSFALTGGSADGGFGAVWGRGAVSRFDGREGSLTLDGEVLSALVGTDWTRGRTVAGLALGHSRGEGSYRGEGSGTVSSTLTGVYPYGRHEVNERLSVWGAAGYGEGTLTLTPANDTPIETGMDLAMAAVGGRSVVAQAPPEGGLELSVTSDALIVRTTSDEARENGMSLAASEAGVTRLRLGLEGTWRGLETGGGGLLAPSFEIGVRHDGGDAETGFGTDIGAGLAWSDPSLGVQAELRGRGLLTHAEGGFRESGFAGSLAWDPDPGSDRGPSLTISRTLGAEASGGMDALLRPEASRALAAANDNGDDNGRGLLEAKAGYGFALFDGGWTGTPEVGFGRSGSMRETMLGWRLAEARETGLVFGLDLEGTRRETLAGGEAPEQRLELGLGWRLAGRRRTAFDIRLEGSRHETPAGGAPPGHRLGLGFGWRVEGVGSERLEFRVEGALAEGGNDDGDRRIGLTLTARW